VEADPNAQNDRLSNYEIALIIVMVIVIIAVIILLPIIYKQEWRHSAQE
jgi:hypothetical protein